jgi:uncharacterized delta-60 repeat protein
MRNNNIHLILLISSYLIFTGVCLPQAGQLDTTFGNSGETITPISINLHSPNYNNLDAIAMQNDGKIVAAGYYTSLIGIMNGYTINEGFSLVRFNSNGSLDYSFGIGGIVITPPIEPQDSYCDAIALQKDGRIIAAGVYNNPNSNFALIRYNKNGSVDSTFGTNGLVTTSIYNGARILAVALQNDEKIIAAGDCDNNGNNFALARYKVDGSLDITFGAGGIATIPIGQALSVAIQNDGKILAAGVATHLDSNNAVIVRLNTDGSLDNTFGTQGMIIGSANSNFNSVILQKDGKIIAAGGIGNENHYGVALVRYIENGDLDTSFGNKGIVTTFIDSLNSDAHSIKLRTDGKIIVSGGFWYNENSGLVVIQYNDDGSIDNNFGTDGKVITQMERVTGDINSSILIGQDFKIIALGSSYSDHFKLVRYNQNGSLDNSFRVDYLDNPSGQSEAAASSEASGVDGKIVTAGYSFNGLKNSYDFALARYDTNGYLDITFDTTGIVTTAIGTSNDFANSVLIQKNGKIVAGGYSSDINKYYDFALVRYNTDGSLDNTFGTNGVVTTSLGSTSNDEIRSIAIQEDGKILAAGSSDYGGYDDFALARYNSDGSLDHTFGTNGIVTTTVGPSSTDEAYSVIVQKDGKIIVAGNSNYGFYFDFTLSRYNTDGSPDNSFGSNGIVTTRIGTSDDFIKSTTIQSDGKIVVAGSANNGNDYDFTLVRYNQDGSLDSTFGNGGMVTTPIGTLDDGANSISIQSDGKIVAAGYTDNGNNYDFACVRYNENGTIDSTFGLNGIATNSSGISNDVVNSLAIQNDGNIIAAGYSSSGLNYSVFSLLRYNGKAQNVVSIQEKTRPPSVFTLEQNYPNPFNPTTTIKFEIPKSSFVNLKVYDILGREVANLVNEEKEAGNYDITFNAGNLSSGVYVYQLKAGNFVTTKKLMLIK